MLKAKILVVEDKSIVAEDIKGCLEKLGYEVPAIATSAKEAIKSAEELKPDLVLMDIVLKGAMDGIEAANEIRKRFNIPIIYLTAYTDDNLIERARITEPFGYIVKPFKERELQINIEIALYRAKELKEKDKVLVVEDESIVANDIKMALQNLGYEVSAIASKGEDAIQKAEETEPDLVLMDIVLEGEMDGIEAAEKIKERFNIPIVYLTAYTDDKFFERAKLTEPMGYIVKPFEDRELKVVIEMAIYKAKMKRGGRK